MVELDLWNVVFGSFDLNSTDEFFVVFEGKFDELALFAVEDLLFDLEIEAELVVLVEDVDEVVKESLGVFKEDGYHFLVLFEGAGRLTVEHLGAEGDYDGVFVGVDEEANVFGFDDVDEEHSGQRLLGLEQFVDHLEGGLDVFEGLGVEEDLNFHCCWNESERVGLVWEVR